MTARPGREFLNTPGPTNIPDRVLNAMHRPAIDFSGPDFLELSLSCFRDIKQIFRTESEVFLYACNGHGAWEAGIANVLQAGDKILVPETGNFSCAWRDTAEAFGVEIEEIPEDWRHAIDPEKIAERLKADTAHSIKAVLVVQIDTATGVTSDVAGIRAVMDRVGHPALLMVDTVASLGVVDFRMDDWGVDVAVCASQKGLMMPPGLGLVAASAKALAVARDGGGSPNRYWDWTFRLLGEHYQRYCGTAPEHLIFGLRESINIMLEEGMDAVIARHQMLSDAVRAAVEVWSEAGALSFNALVPAQRANSVTPILIDDAYDALKLREICRETFRCALGGGLAKLHGKAFRIGHMGDQNVPMILGTLSAVEATLKVMNIPHGENGVSAAIASIAKATRV
jgi:alanine-glyoxylate transaminase/serine-glyoxylate transaminase/serine-pyruvate transaminase